MTGGTCYSAMEMAKNSPLPQDETAQAFYHHSQAQRVSTDAVIVPALRRQYPELNVTTVPVFSCNLLAYAASGHATATLLDDPAGDPFSASLKWRVWVPPASRLDGESGMLFDQVMFGKYMYKWKDEEFLLYVVNGRDGIASYPQIVNNYILSTDPQVVDRLLLAASAWNYNLHDEIWVFDSGYWQKSRELWQSVQHSDWQDVILDDEMKAAIIGDVENFFASRDVYKKLKVPWKRGIIYYGPPGNGKTISIKAMMHALYQREAPIPTLYVRSLVSYGGPEFAIKQVFQKARQTSPCYLIFEDLDSIVSNNVRSYFLNEVDGLKDNDGILMVGTTNHIDRLDDGIAKRPSRFDRKYLFPNPSLPQRTSYAHFWQRKLSSTPEIEFPDSVCPAVAGITHGFSFAYMQEAFVAALLAIAARTGKDSLPGAASSSKPQSKSEASVEGTESTSLKQDDVQCKVDQLSARFELEQEKMLAKIRELELSLNKSQANFNCWPNSDGNDGGSRYHKDDADLDELPLWRQLKKQIAILRKGIEQSENIDMKMASLHFKHAEENSPSSPPPPQPGRWNNRTNAYGSRAAPPPPPPPPPSEPSNLRGLLDEIRSGVPLRETETLQPRPSLPPRPREGSDTGYYLSRY